MAATTQGNEFHEDRKFREHSCACLVLWGEQKFVAIHIVDQIQKELESTSYRCRAPNLEAPFSIVPT